MEGVERMWDTGRRASQSLGRSISRSMNMENWGMEDVFVRSSTRGSSMGSRAGVDDDEVALRWAAIEKLPTYSRLRTGLLKAAVGGQAEQGTGAGRRYEHKPVDVRKLGMRDRQEFIDRVFKVSEEDNERFLKKLRNRIDKVGIQLPTVEVRFEKLNVEAKCHVGDRALPTLVNMAKDIAESSLDLLGIKLGKRTSLTVIS